MTAQATRGRPSADVIEDVAFLLDQHPYWTCQDVAHRLGVERKTIQRALSADRGDRPDLRAQLTRNARLAGWS